MKKNSRFIWGWKQHVTFAKLKKPITNPDVVAYFKNDCKIIIAADASPVHLGAVLTQLEGGL